MAISFPTTPTPGQVLSTDSKDLVYDGDKSRWNSFAIQTSGTLPRFIPPTTFTFDYQGTLTTSGSTLTTSVFGGGNGVSVSNDGTKVYSYRGNQIQTFTLSTAWDLSSATAGSVIAPFSHGNINVQGMAFDPTGTIAVILDEGSGGLMYQYSLSTAWDVSTLSYNTSIGEKNFGLGMLGSTNSETGPCRWYDNGNWLMVFGRSRSIINALDCSANPYTLNGATKPNGSVMLRDVGASSSGAAWFNTDGTKLDVWGGTFQNNTFQRYSLSTPFDVSTLDTVNYINTTVSGGPGNEGTVWHNTEYNILIKTDGSTISRIDVS